MNTKKVYNILGFGEIMMRLSPPKLQPIQTAVSFDINYGGAECNVITSLSKFGHNCSMLTKVSNDSIGDKVIQTLMSNKVNANNISKENGRLGKYFVENGQGYRNTNVIYDRADSVFCNISLDELAIDKALDNIDLIHITGVTPALNENTKNLTLKIIKRAREKNILVSYDSNYRSKLWSLDDCGKFLREVLNYVDIAFLGNLDAINFLNIEVCADDENYGLGNMYKKIQKMYPNVKLMASTKRIIHSANNNSLTGYLYINNNLYKSDTYTFDIIDRIGGGDAYVAGILNAYLKGLCENEIVNFGVIASVYKHSYLGDVNLCSEDMVLQTMKDGINKINR